MSFPCKVYVQRWRSSVLLQAISLRALLSLVESAVIQPPKRFSVPVCKASIPNVPKRDIASLKVMCKSITFQLIIVSVNSCATPITSSLDAENNQFTLFWIVLEWQTITKCVSRISWIAPMRQYTFPVIQICYTRVLKSTCLVIYQPTLSIVKHSIAVCQKL